MKRTKKLLALVMAMVMAFSLMAVTAAAYGAEEHTHAETVEPKGVAMQCEYCGRGMLQVNSGNPATLAFKCTNVNCSHYGDIFEYPNMG